MSTETNKITRIADNSVYALDHNLLFVSLKTSPYHQSSSFRSSESMIGLTLLRLDLIQRTTIIIQNSMLNRLIITEITNDHLVAVVDKLNSLISENVEINENCNDSRKIRM